jgi:hypothetical protein
MTKIVYDAGAFIPDFHLSHMAMELYAKLAKKDWRKVRLQLGDRGDPDFYIEVWEEADGSRVNTNAIPRHDPALVEVVETLRDGASGLASYLKVTEIPDGSIYRIEKIALGAERVVIPEDLEWINPRGNPGAWEWGPSTITLTYNANSGREVRRG